MTRKLMMLFAVVAAMLGVWAETETVGDYTWTYRINGDTAEIYQGVWGVAISPYPTGAVTIPSTLGGKPVTSIDASAFLGCSELTSVTIPDSVTSIGNRAFSECYGLRSVTIPDSVTSIGDYAFEGCSGLTSMTIPDSVTSIGDGAFYGCSGLTSVTIPDSVTSIGWSAFSGCSGLTSVTIPDSVTSIGYLAFSGCSGLTSVTIPDSVVSIGDWAFSHCYGLTSMTIPDSVTSIGGCAFYNCSGLASVTIPDSVTSIGDDAFRYCDGLRSVTIGNGVTSIGNYAFSGCSGLTSVTIGNGVMSIGEGAFYACSGLMTISVCSRNVNYKSVAGLLLTKDGKTLVFGVNGNVTIPDSVTSIGGVAFSFRSGLASITIPDCVTSIGVGAFYNCGGLTSVTIPDSVTSIGINAFSKCRGLTNVIFKGNAPAVEGWGYAFIGVNENCVVKVPASATGYGDGDSWQGMKVVRYQSIDELSFAVTFNANGGSVTPASKSIKNDQVVGELPTPARSGYTFDGWFTAASGGTQISASTKVVDNVTYYAHWVADESTTKYTVTFDVNGSGALRDEEVMRKVVKNTAVGELPIPMVPSLADSGFGDFLGWFTAKTGGAQISADTIVTKDITYYAHWKYFRYIVLDANGGEFSEEYDDWWPFVENGTTIGSLPAVSRSGYSFDGWYTAVSGGTKVLADTKITATASNIREPLKYYAHWSADISLPDVTTWKFYEEADDDEGLNLAAWEEWDEKDVAFWMGAGINMAIPVSGNLSASDIVLVAGTYSGYGRPQVVSDEWMFVKHCTALETAVGYDPYEDDEYDQGAYGLVFEDDVKGRNYSLSMDIWPQKKVVSDRKWILLEIGGNPTKGCKTFYLGVKGRDDVGYSRFRIYATPDQGVSQRPFNWSSQRELAVLPIPIGGGTTSGSGMYANGTRVSLSAKPNAGYEFEGWYDLSSGQMFSTSASQSYTTTGSDKTIFARFRQKAAGYLVTFDANGGIGGWSRSIAYGAAIVAPTVTRRGYAFAGWSPAVAKTVPAGNVTYVAQWTRLPAPGPEGETALFESVDGAVAAGAASVYDGYLVDSRGNVVGTIQVKVGKANAKTGLAAVKATAVIGGKKVALKAEGGGKVSIAEGAPTVVAFSGDGENFVATLGADGMSGESATYSIDGGRNLFASKDKGAQGVANATLGKWLGAVNVAWDGGMASVAIGNKGKCKATVILADGTKATANAQLIVGDEWCCVPVVVSKKMNLAFALWLSSDGSTVMVEGLGGSAVVGKAGSLATGAKFHIAKDAALWSKVAGMVLADYLPDGAGVTQSGTKWEFQKAGKVAYLRGTTDVDESKLGENPAALKLRYKAKDGSFKGSFKVYSGNGGKLKATKVDVNGFMVGDVGIGTATIRRAGSVKITIE